LLHLIEQALKKAQWQQPDFSQRPDNLDPASAERPAYQH
jgi:hypothetical protein